jgi:hypothetical protein
MFLNLNVRHQLKTLKKNCSFYKNWIVFFRQELELKLFPAPLTWDILLKFYLRALKAFSLLSPPFPNR